MKKIYFDYAATTPCDPQVVEAMLPFFTQTFANASSPHALGQEANTALESSRQSVAQFIGANPKEIIFNSGATEGNNHVISGVAYALMEKGDHIVVSSLEHHSVLEPVEQLRRDGFKVTVLPVDHDGLVNPQDIKKAIIGQTILVAVMHASNEIGTIEPITDISRVTKERNIPFLVDACQTVGHIPVDVNVLGCDYLTFSAHKFYGPKGVGALYVRDKAAITPFLFGGDQERSRRASTQNISAIVGLAKALEICKEKMHQEETFQKKLRDRLLAQVLKKVDGVKINGHRTNRLPNNAHFSFEGIESEALLMSLDMNNICASMGSACTSGAMEPSHVLRAIGLSDELAYGALRVTIGRWTTENDIEYFLEQLPKVIGSLRV